jgi:hypothetical protein
MKKKSLIRAGIIIIIGILIVARGLSQLSDYLSLVMEGSAESSSPN